MYIVEAAAKTIRANCKLVAYCMKMLNLNSGGVTSTPPYVVAKGLPALIAFAINVGAMPTRKPKPIPCANAVSWRDHKNEMARNRK